MICRIPIGHFFEIRHQIAQTFGEVRDRKEPLAHIPPLFGKSSIIWNKGNWNNEIYVQYNGQKPVSQYSLSSTDRFHLATPDGMPAWATWNFRASYRFENVMAQASVENIFDRHYRVFASGLSAMGRNFTFSLRGNF